MPTQETSKKVDKIHFDSIIELSDYLDGNWHHWENGLKSGGSFTDCISHSKCRDILRNGGDHPKSAERMTKAELDMAKIPASDFDQPMLTNHVAGHRPNVGAYLAGSPVSMFRFEQRPQPNKAVKMFVNVGGSAMVAHKTLMTRGAAILGAIDALQSDGYAVELTVGFIAENHTQGREWHGTVKIKDFGDTWNPAAIAYMLAEPSFFRRNLFALCNIEAKKNPDGAARELGSTLGYPKKKSNFTDYDIEFEALHGADGWTPENAVSKAMKKVYAWLERNKQGEV